MDTPWASRSERYRSIASLWEVKSESGVTIHPLKAAVQAADNLGCDVREARHLLIEAQRHYSADDLDRLLVTSALVNHQLNSAIRPLQSQEPASWDAYRAALASPVQRDSRTIEPETYADRVKGAWLGKCIGTALGD
ncbi:hypothetical protein KJ567_03150, partial [Candidatus Bipolaricaulota bacterium]|nr:hypothetical protein [Candidatus Bipolaricaulota bacterium]